MIHRNIDHARHVNIYTLFVSIPTFIYIIPIPILQTVLYKPQNIWEQITSYALSILFMAVFVAFAVANYLNKRYTTTLDYTFIQKGFPIRVRFCIPHSRLQSVIVQHNPLPSLFSAVKIQLNTPATKAKKGDAMFYLSKERANLLIKEIYDDIGSHVQSYKAQNLRVFFMAAIWSNPISGLLLIAPFINNAGKIVGEELSTALLGSFDLSVFLMYIGLPPATAFIAYAMLVCYAASVVADFIRNANFTAVSYTNGILIKRGTVQRTFFLTNCKKLNAITVSQSLLMLPFHLYSAYIHTVGAGKTKGDKSLLIAAENRSKIYELLTKLLDGLDGRCATFVKPEKKALISYLLLPFSVLGCDIALSLLMQTARFWNSITFTFMLFTIPWLMAWCIFRIIAFHKSGIGFNGRFVVLRSYSKLTLNTEIIPLNKIQLCMLRQTLIQRMSKRCNVRIFVYGEKRTYFEIKHLPIQQAISLTESINDSITLSNHVI